MNRDSILTLNAGSSSIKAALFSAAEDGLPTLFYGQVESLGLPGGARLRARLPSGVHIADGPSPAVTHIDGLRAILALVEGFEPRRRIVAVGHRVVHGGVHHADPVLLDDAVLAELTRLIPLAPLHQPHNVAGINAAMAAFAGLPQVACFDTAFHRGQPMVSDMFALPRRFYDEGLRRYGFHGLSYEYLTGRLAELVPDLAAGRVVYCHLGNGASACAVHNGQSIASTMGFSTLDGLPMGTRSGQIDPGVLLYLMNEKGMDGKAISDLLYSQSGLKGLSGLTSDMRTLEAADEPAAALAIDYFTHHIRREVAALAADLGGLDAVVFSGGIGENAPRVRKAVVEGLSWLGLALDEGANAAGEMRISPQTARVAAFVIPTDEERMIARHVKRIIRAR